MGFRIAAAQTPGVDLTWEELYRIASIYRELPVKLRKNEKIEQFCYQTSRNSYQFKKTNFKNTTPNFKEPYSKYEKWCEVHKTNSHRTAECREVKKLSESIQKKKNESKNVREISDVSVDNENKFLEYELNNKKNDCYSHLKYNNKFCTSVYIRNNYINALIDTGSELNVLDISLAQKSKSIIKNFFTLKNANKSEIETYGKQNVDIKIGNYVYRNIEVVLADL
ncbi:hypothetical protein COBT_003958, partial [Conglomerata obtusa]